MTKHALLVLIRKRFEQLPGEAQERAVQRALARPVLVWDYLTIKQLWRVYGAVRAVERIDAAFESEAAQ